MFYNIRFQTGEAAEVAKEMKKGNIPCMDVDDNEEFEWFAAQLAGHGIYKAEGIPHDKNARDKVQEPDFEFRAAFSGKPSGETGNGTLMYLDVYSEPIADETYDPVGEM